MLLPLLAFVLQAVLGKKSRSGNSALTAIVASTIISLFGGFIPSWNETTMLQKWGWFTIGEHSLHICILLNNLTALMQRIVCIIALRVHIGSPVDMTGE